MNSKPLFTVSAVMELGAGVAIAVAPSIVIPILFGSDLESPTGLAVGRLLGAALLAIGIACWCARREAGTRAAHAVVVAMTVYNIGAVAVLAHAGVSAAAKGPMVWVAVLVHLAMTVWCVACIGRLRNV